MNYFFEDVVLPAVIIIACIVGGISVVWGVATGLEAINAHWNCSSWHQRTGEQTQVIAGSCYVKSGDRWELFDTYIRNHHVDVKAE